MDPILELAKELGKKIADSQQAKALKAAGEALDGDAETSKLVQDFQAQSDKVRQLSEQNKPIEVEDKRALEDLHRKLVASDTFKKYTAAQVEYIDLMRKVNDAIRGQLGPIEGAGGA